jgi:hypothetical protein
MMRRRRRIAMTMSDDDNNDNGNGDEDNSDDDDNKNSNNNNNRILKIIFRPKRKAVMGGWRKFHNEEFHKICTFHQILLVW